VFKSNLSARSLRAVLLTGAATATVFAFTGPVSAQEAGGETVIVTGSRIPQTGLTSISPVSVVSQQEAKYQGTSNLESLLNNLPSVFAGQTNTLTNGSTGTATVNLRGLGSVRTLVLVNGRRLMPGDPFVPAPDLNQIPASMVERVEIETGGASAVYGSDAVAGVVNFIMRQDFEGIEVSGQYSIFNADNDCGECSQRLAGPGYPDAPNDTWDGGAVDTSVVMGINSDNGKGNITAYMTYRHNQALFESQRDYSACTYGAVGNTGFACAGSSNFNRIITLDSPLGGQYFGGSTVWVPFTGANNQLFNFGALNTFQRPDTRWTAGFFGHYEIAKWLETYTEFMFMDDDSVGSIAPSGYFLGAGPIYGFAQQANCDNPLMTAQQNALLCGNILPTTIDTRKKIGADPNPFFGQTFLTEYGAGGPNGNGYDDCSSGICDGGGNIAAGEALVEWGRRNIEGGLRVTDLHHQSYRSVVGIRGDLGDGWAYDVYGLYGRTNFSTRAEGDWSKVRSQNALQVSPITNDCINDAANCVPLDVFHGFGAITQDMLNYVGLISTTTGFTREEVVSGQLTGDLGSIGFQSPWAKNPVGVALGAEYRNEAIEIDPDDPARLGDGTGAGGKTAPQPFAQFSVREVFAEARVPLVEDAPWAKVLQLNGAYRYSSYSSTGSTNTYEYGAEWQPIDDFRLRGSIQRAVRAPNVLELFTPQNTVLTDGSFNDPCFSDPSAFAACSAATGGASLHGTAPGSALLSCPASQCNQLTGGNTHLKPETADTRTAGIVLTPTFIPGFSATVDYFDIDLKDAISVVGAENILVGCYNLNQARCAISSSATSSVRFTAAALWPT
jgi:outer membrane receptor protein involved in Fe transport